MGIFDNTTYSVRDLESTDYLNQSAYDNFRPVIANAKRTGTRTRKLRLGANVGHKNKVIASRRKKNKSARKARKKNR